MSEKNMARALTEVLRELPDSAMRDAEHLAAHFLWREVARRAGELEMEQRRGAPDGILGKAEDLVRAMRAEFVEREAKAAADTPAKA